MNARGNIDRSSNSPVLREIKDTINEVKYGCLWLLVEGFIEVMNGLGMTLEARGEICMCLRAALLCEQFCQARMEVPSYLSSPTSWNHLLCLSVFSSSEVLGKIATFRSKLPTAACLSREDKRGNCEANLLQLVFGITDTTAKSFTASFARWGVTFERGLKILALWVR